MKHWLKLNTVALCIAVTTCAELAWGQDAGVAAAAATAAPMAGIPVLPASPAVEHWIQVGLQILGGLTLLATAAANLGRRVWKFTSFAAKFGGWDFKSINTHEPDKNAPELQKDVVVK